MSERQSVALGPGSRVLVTGGAGFIGSHLVERLRAGGADVTIADSFVTGRVENLGGELAPERLVVGDLTDLLRGGRLPVEAYDVIFHLAANAYVPVSVQDPTFDYEINTAGTFRLLEEMRRRKATGRLVNISSAAVYGDPVKQPMSEEDPTIPIAPYGVSKLAGERYAAVYAQLYGLRTVSIRLFSVYGPRQRKQVVYDLIRKLSLDPTRLEVIGDGTATRDLNYVGDVAEAMMLVASRAPARGEAFNLASGTSCTIRELVDTLCAAAGYSPRIAYTGAARPGDAHRWEVDVRRIAALGYRPRMSLLEGLRATKRWFDAASG